MYILFSIQTIYNYVGGYDHTCESIWRCDNVGGLGEHVTCDMFRFSILF